MRHLIVFLLLIFCSCEDELRWNLISKPIVENVRFENNLDSIHVSMDCTFDGYDENNQFGFCWSSYKSPELSDSLVYAEEISTGRFEFNIAWFGNRNFYLKPFAKNELGIFYGEEIHIIWNGDSSNLPVLSNFYVKDLSFYNGKIHCEVSNGGLALSDFKVCISTNFNSSIDNANFVFSGQNSSVIDTFFTSFEDDTRYYARAYAKNIAGALYTQELTFTTKKFYNIGDTGPGGGFVFYFKPDTVNDWQFLEAASNDLTIQNWNNNLNFFNAIRTGLGDGKSNTLLISTSFNSAAFLCNTLTVNGKSDWYLPARDELIVAYENLYKQGIGDFINNADYWTSSEDPFFQQNAWTVQMKSNNNNVVSMKKNVPLLIRPIRRF